MSGQRIRPDTMASSMALSRPPGAEPPEMTRVDELEAALRKCANLTRLQHESPETVRWVGEEVGRIVSAALVKVNACRVRLQTPTDEAAFAEIVAAGLRHMKALDDAQGTAPQAPSDPTPSPKASP